MKIITDIVRYKKIQLFKQKVKKSNQINTCNRSTEILANL